MTEQQQAALAQLKLLVEESDQAVLSPPCEIKCEGCPGATGAGCPQSVQPVFAEGENRMAQIEDLGRATFPISTRTMSDEQLLAFLACEDWDVKRTAYKVLIYKSKASDIALSSGLKLPDQSEYYRRLARMYRPNAGGALARADDPIYYRGRR